MARSRTVDARTGEDHEAVVAWYREMLSGKARLPWAKAPWKPVTVGPSWQLNGKGGWLLPDASIGWDVLGWWGTELQHKGKPWRCTLEQARWTLWWYAVNEDGTWVYRDGILQRLKGWGKDPLGACLLFGETLGPCRFAGWDGDTPIATDMPDAWVQTAATALEQTKNTMRLLPGLITPAARKFYDVHVGKELVYALGDTRLIQAVTSSPATLEGARSTAVLKNETQHWVAANQGHEMAAVIDRNNTKGSARSLAITNAPEPGFDSVAERDREAFELAAAGGSMTTGILYDSLEAPPAAPLGVPREDGESDEDHAARTAASISSVLCGVRGDSTWLKPGPIVQSILDTRNPPSRSRRFWFNQIVATEDAWLTPQEFDQLADASIVIGDGELVTLGFDGSKSDDHTALIACSVELDHYWPLGIWVPPDSGEIRREEIDAVVASAFELFDVVGFYGDLYPWESYHDQWATEFGEQLLVKASPSHSTAWDMRGDKERTTRIVESLHAAIVDSQLTHDGNSLMVQHFRNARRAPNRWGVTVRKEARESPRKIDSVPAAALARRARLDYLALPEHRRRRSKRSGVVW